MRKAYEADTSQLSLLFCGPVVALVGLVLGEAVAHRVGLPNPDWNALRLSASGYAVGLAIALFGEGEERVGSPHHAYRRLEIGLAASGGTFSLIVLAGTLFGVWMWRAVGDVVFVAAPSATFLVRRRTDRQRAATFAVMAAARLGHPLLYSVFPFISMGIIFGLAALYFFLRSVFRAR